MGVKLEAEVTVQDIDEAIFHINNLLKEEAGHRLTPRRKTLLTESIDDLLDARNRITLQCPHGTN